MAANVENLTCPGCGFPVKIGDQQCPAGHPLNISTFNSVNSMDMPMVSRYARHYEKELSGNPDDMQTNYSLGLCYLKLKLYDKALGAFEKAIEDNFDNSETYFYAAICLLQGKKAFLQQRPTIDKIMEYVNAALMIEPKGIYYYFMAYIKYDYFSRKYFKTFPTYSDTLAMAIETGLSDFDIEQLYSVLGVSRPECL